MMISIIVPIYNVEPYLSRCLDSIVMQRNNLEESYEVILVNDGSTDNSLKIAEEYAESYGWTLINQQNQGQSVARNIGMRHSKGDYVWFVDSDDWIKEDALKILVSLIDDQDIIFIGAKTVYDSKLEETIFSPSDSYKTGKEMLLADFALNTPFYIYKKKFIDSHNLYYYPGIFHEDFEFIPRTLYLAGEVSSIKIPLYFVFKRPNSTTTTINPKRAFDMLKVIESLNHFSQRIEEKEIRSKFDNLISLALNNSLKYSSSLKGSTLDLYFETLLMTDCLTHMRKSSKIKYKIQAYIIKYFPKSLLIFRVLCI